MMRAVAITLKIPDNTAYTAAVALRNVGVDVERVERSEIWFVDGSDIPALLARVQSDATIFNPNKHRAEVLDAAIPRDGEVWIAPLQPDDAQAPLPQTDRYKAAVAWRLFSAGTQRANRQTLEEAAGRLLCNPAFERAVLRRAQSFDCAQDDNGNAIG